MSTKIEQHLLIVQIPKSLNTKISRHAKSLGMHKKWIVSKALMEYLERQKEIIDAATED